MPDISLALLGQTYQSRSVNVSNQITQNFYIEVNQGAPAALVNFPGLKSFATAGVGKNRGTAVFNGVLYTVSGTELYSVSSTGGSTLIGTINGAGQCSMTHDGNNLVIATDSGKPYTYDGTTLTQGTDVDLTSSATVTYINRRVVYDGNNADVIFADLDAPLTVNSANVTSEDVAPDDTLAVMAKDQKLIVFSEKSIVPYYNSGSGNPPYAVIQNATIDGIGLGAIYSLAKNRQYIYFLGSDRQVYRLTGLQAQPIGSPAMGQAISSYSNVSDARGVTFTLDNQDFYLITFPGNASWLYNENVGWSTLTYGLDGAPHLINSYQRAYNKDIVADRRNGNLYELDYATYMDNGESRQLQRDTLVINGATFEKPGAEVFMSRLELKLEMGTSLLIRPARVSMQYSDDFGNTWSSARVAEIGALGEYKTKVEWHDLGHFTDRMFRFRMTDPVKWILTGLNADVRLGVV